MIKDLFDGSFLKQAKQMKEKITQLQKEMAQKKVTVSSGGGMVEVTVNGKQEVLSLKIEPEVLKNQDASMIEDLVLAAVNEAIKKSKEAVTKELGELTGGLNIPGLF